MGWVRTLLLGDVGNRLDISDVEQDLELQLLVAALMRHLTRKGIVDEADLRIFAEG